MSKTVAILSGILYYVVPYPLTYSKLELQINVS